MSLKTWPFIKGCLPRYIYGTLSCYQIIISLVFKYYYIIYYSSPWWTFLYTRYYEYCVTYKKCVHYIGIIAFTNFVYYIGTKVSPSFGHSTIAQNQLDSVFGHQEFNNFVVVMIWTFFYTSFGVSPFCIRPLAINKKTKTKNKTRKK